MILPQLAEGSSMPSSDERVTVTLPSELVADIDRRERNRSRFIREAVRRELERRKREAFRLSLTRPHDDTAEWEELGLEDWLGGESDTEADRLLEHEGGTAVSWKPESGWTREEER